MEAQKSQTWNYGPNSNGVHYHPQKIQLFWEKDQSDLPRPRQRLLGLKCYSLQLGLGWEPDPLPRSVLYDPFDYFEIRVSTLKFELA
jgi:hypothetical protein